MTPTVYSIVVPLYETARFLPALLGSLERQRGRGDEFALECLFVDDSSPDDAGRIASEWLTRTGIAGRVIEQPNRGVSAARNNGLDLATGEWIAFVDSDDFLSDGYVLGVHRFLRSVAEASNGVSLVSCNVARYHEIDDRYDHAHPLRDKFNRGDRLYPLEQHPEFIQSQAASAFFPLAKLRASGVRFLEGLHAAEDALFVSSYLLTETQPVIACVASSDYYYRQRASGDSAVNRFARNPDYYFARFTRGYLPLFAKARATHGSVPHWLGQYFLYDMRWFFPREMDATNKATHLSAAQKAEVLSSVAAVLKQLDPTWVRDYSITGMGLELRDLMLSLMDAPLLSEGLVEVHGIDEHRDLVQLRYRFVGELPVESVTVGGRPAVVVAAKTRRLDYLGQTRMRQRILWIVADDDLVVLLDGRQQKIVLAPPSVPAFSASRARLGFDSYVDPIGPIPPSKALRPLPRRMVGRVRREAAALAPALFRNARVRALGEELRESRAAKIVRIHAQRPRTRARYGGAWLFIDHVNVAGDNAEALYRHVRVEAPDVNAVFVIDRRSSDWQRLRRSGAHVLAYGSLEHRAALMNAEFVISSQLGAESAAPLSREIYWDGRIPWRFVYLPRDLIRDDHSIWLNGQPITLMATAADDELRALTDDDTPSSLTALEVTNTGFARHDEIVRERAAAEGRRRRLVLFAPSDDDPLWLELFNDTRLLGLADRFEVDLAFLDPGRGDFRSRRLPERVHLAAHADGRAALLVSTAVLVTNSSPISLDAAIAGAAVVRYQPADGDASALLDEREIGAVAADVDELLEALIAQLDPARPIEHTGEHRHLLPPAMRDPDGHAAERVLHAIRALR
ncbi:glycosyltransferase [Microbacterium sp.]|uniref:bifunctional glycosyltransferase/CDP-glycerol:glycerophosphate glycerophosphotransferase n=1 Tax=Microbacterium sp. TaxID=51671 RepID=UPI002810AC96|nr:glycosyltransferase [Microbacterium sp.]